MKENIYLGVKKDILNLVMSADTSLFLRLSFFFFPKKHNTGTMVAGLALYNLKIVG